MSLFKIKKVKAGHKPGSVHSFWLEIEWAIIYLGLLLPIASSGSNQELGLWPSSVPRLAPSRGLPSQHLSMLLVRSYRTFAPLPCLLGFPHEAVGGVFLWHYPHGHPHWELPSKPGQIGARTFLNRILQLFAEVPLRSPPLLSTPSCLKA